MSKNDLTECVALARKFFKKPPAQLVVTPETAQRQKQRDCMRRLRQWQRKHGPDSYPPGKKPGPAKRFTAKQLAARNRLRSRIYMRNKRAELKSKMP